MAETEGSKRLIEYLIKVARDISRGSRGNPEQIFELTKAGTYPELISELAESFGMMIVKLEAREFQLDHTIEKLRAANRELKEIQKKLTYENTNLKMDLRGRFSPERIIGSSRQIRDVLIQVEKVADTPVNVFITGETGTGKELIAKCIHYNSNRCSRNFVALNCAALPETLFESELFGIERGVATGVDKRMGRIEQADGGTLFLDEIADMSLASQAKLLRVLEEREFERVGGRKPICVDIRIVTATNKDLKHEVAEGRFREDLFYRLKVVHLRLPPLRERTEDIPLLLNAFLDLHTRRFGRGPLRADPDALAQLCRYPWPGNIRELENEVERAVALCCGDSITVSDLSEELIDYQADEPEPDPTCDTARCASLVSVEKTAIRQALAESGGNKSQAARKLGLSREGLRKKMVRYGLS